MNQNFNLNKQTGRFDDEVDPAHKAMDLTPIGSISHDVWRDKYRWGNERSLAETVARVADGIYANDPDLQAKEDATSAMRLGLWMPAGRILAGAGTPKRVTLMNCYVNATIEDSMESIMQANTNAALTMQQGGGIGTDFSTIRPTGAILKRTHTKASGPLPFMKMWDSMSSTIRSAGDRRGAMMGTLCDTHPDLPAFVEAKKEKGALTNFNVSILVSDAFMEAVREDEEWLLYFSEPPLTREEGLEQYDFEDEESGAKQYVYSVWKARDLWRLITETTYEYSEPGVIFIDRVNDLNNLHYCETIRCTNPCGEQPLPPHGTCNLGAVNLARMVRDPFSPRASFSWSLLKDVVRVGVRFLDNVIDVTNYPLHEQWNEEKSKRRLGLGITGLADALAQLGIRYGDAKAGDFAESVMETIAEVAYGTSIDLAGERGSFPLFNADGLLASNTFIAQRLHSSLHDRIRSVGLRNALLLTNAPTGTTSVVFGDISSSLEPVFAHKVKRKVRQEKDTDWKEYIAMGYGARLWHALKGPDTPLPSHMVETKDLKVEEHVFMQGRIQKWVDASVSKTVNCPPDMEYDDFVRVYDMAYAWGCKGCTTYRPSPVRGAILERLDTPTGEQLARPETLEGFTTKIKWPRRSALYLTVNMHNGRPWEVFISSKDGRQSEWTTALTMMITGIFRKGGDIAFVAEELQQIQSIGDGAWVQSKYYGSLPAYIGHILASYTNPPTVSVETPPLLTSALVEAIQGEMCPNCLAPALIREEGCKKCKNCGHSEC